jgi:transcription antitermination factor NusA-like protein
MLVRTSMHLKLSIKLSKYRFIIKSYKLLNNVARNSGEVLSILLSLTKNMLIQTLNKQFFEIGDFRFD